MKYGISIKVNLSKIDQNRVFNGQQGQYLDLTAFIDTENEGQYGDHGPVNQSKNKDENIKMPYIGNVKIFWRGESDQQQAAPPSQPYIPPPPQQQPSRPPQQQAPMQRQPANRPPPPPANLPQGDYMQQPAPGQQGYPQQAPAMEAFDDDIPFS